MSEDNGNDNKPSKHAKHYLTLAFEPDTFSLVIGGHTANLDMALAMLDMARREVEGKLRAAAVAGSLARPGVVPPIDFLRRQ